MDCSSLSKYFSQDVISEEEAESTPQDSIILIYFFMLISIKK